ncbi:putative gnat family protein [Daldinia childiae]|uniref:putative gnat family protein n=1 Tax=Daldinia childiae TaxID=326645 RepID=UPI001446CCE5|nr:putative gnat family protein [Daldinia childiae]KAF3067452.1 putative gnat family protein [Daldinia childiae]
MTSPPNFVVSPVDYDKDWDDLFTTYWDSWKEPLQAVGQLTFSGIGVGGPQEAEAFAATKQAYLAAALANPNQHWVKIEDPSRVSRGLCPIIGGGGWTEYQENPFRAHSEVANQGCNRLLGPGFEAGSERYHLSAELYMQLWSWRPRMMKTAHVYGQALWVIPEYRHLSATACGMDYWIRRIDELGVESYLEGSSLSTSLYLKHGFIIIGYPTMVFHHKDKPSADWTKLVHDIQAHPVSVMWRPKGGVYKEGETVLPWQGKPRQAKL